MLKNRNYLITNNDFTFDEFMKKYELDKQNTRTNLTTLVEKKDNPEDKLFIFYPDDSKVGVRPIRTYVEQMEEENVNRAIIIAKESITSFAKNALSELKNGIKLEYFNENELQFDITEHVLVPQHILLTKQQKQSLLERYKLNESQLPLMRNDDPISRYYGLEIGDIVKIIRPSETAGRYVTYRIVSN